MDSLDRLSQICIWKAEQHRIQRSRFPSEYPLDPDPLYIVTLVDRKTEDIRYLILNHKFPIRRTQGAGGCGLESMIGYADIFKGEIRRCNLPIERRWKIRSAKLLNSYISRGESDAS